MDGKTPLEWRLGGGNAALRFPWGGRAWHGRVAPSRVAQFCSDAHGAASETAALWTGQRPSIGGWATESGRASPVCGALLTISDQSDHMLVHQS